ncbi:MAG: hypothetical protein IT443_04450 [Phycisphaeraceae bacterium]|nr:hypothetical protein [Phycisphaeraceae bacterium]
MRFTHLSTTACIMLPLALAWTLTAVGAEKVRAKPSSSRLVSQTVYLGKADPKLTRMLTARLGRAMEKPPENSESSGATARLYLPAVEPVSPPWGLIVWISPHDDEELPPTYLRVFKRLKFIAICPQNAGNNQNVIQRLTLALQAAEYARGRYSIDPKRVYVAGFSGGGRCASRLGVIYPDLFQGAIPICGCDYFRPIPVPGQPGKRWDADYRPPPPNLLMQARKESRFVLVTADHDGNQPQTAATFKLGFLKDRFEHVTYLQVPEKGHEPILAGWLEKALAAASLHGTAAP